MTELQKRSFSQINSSTNRVSGTFFMKPPTSPQAEKPTRDQLFSPPVHHRHTIQPQQMTGISQSSFSSLSSLNIQESIHTLLPKPPLSVANRPNSQQNSIALQSYDYPTRNIVQQIHQKFIQQRSLPVQQRGGGGNQLNNQNAYQNIETGGGVTLVNNYRQPSPVIARRVQNLSNSMNHNNSFNKNALNSSASHNNSIDLIVNNPSENMQQDIIHACEKDYLKNQLIGNRENQIFLNNSLANSHHFGQTPPQTIRISSRSENSQINSQFQQQFQGNTLYQPNNINNGYTPRINARSPPPCHAISACSPPQLSSTTPTAVYIQSNQINGVIKTDNHQSSNTQALKKTVTHLSESAQKLLETYKRQKDILFESIPSSLPLPNNNKNEFSSLNAAQNTSQTIGVSQTNYVTPTLLSKIPPPPQQVASNTNLLQNQIQQHQSFSKITPPLKEFQPQIQTPDVQPPQERMRSNSQKGNLQSQTANQSSNNYSSLPQMMPPPGSCTLAKITSRPVTSIEEKNLIQEYKQKNTQRRNSFSSSVKSTGNQLPTVVEAPLEQSMRLSSLLVNTSVFNQGKNSRSNSQSGDESLEENAVRMAEQIIKAKAEQIIQGKEEQINIAQATTSANITRQQYVYSEDLYKDFSTQNQIIVVEDFESDTDHFMQGDNHLIEDENQDNNRYIKVEREEKDRAQQNNNIEFLREVVRSAETHYIQNDSDSEFNSKNQAQERNEVYQTQEGNNHGSPKNKNIPNGFGKVKKERNYRDAQTSPIRIIDAKPSCSELQNISSQYSIEFINQKYRNSLISDTNLFESKTLVESQFVITDSIGQAIPITQNQIYQQNVKQTNRSTARNSDKIITKRSDNQSDDIDEDYMKNRKKEIQSQIKEKKLQKKQGNNSKTPRCNSIKRQKPATPSNKDGQKSNQIGQNGSPQTKRDSRISLDSVGNTMKQSKHSLEVSVYDSQTQSVPSVQQLALQKRDEILDKIKHIDEQIILHQKFQSQQKDEGIQSLKAQNKLIISNNVHNNNNNNIIEQTQNQIQSSQNNRNSHISTKSNTDIDDTPIKKVQQTSQPIISSATNIQLPVSQQQVPFKNDRSAIKRSESNSSLRRQGSNRKIEGFVIQNNEMPSQVNSSSNTSGVTPSVTTKNSSTSSFVNQGSNKFLNNFKESFVNKNSKLADFSSEMTQAQKQLMNKGYNNKVYKQYPNPISQPTSSRSTNNIKKDLKISNILDKSHESRGTCLSSTTTNKSRSQISDLQQGKRSDNEIMFNFTKQRQTNNLNTKENIKNNASESLGVINLFELSKNKKRDASLVNRNQSREDLMQHSPQQNSYFRVSDKLKEIEMREGTRDSRQMNSQTYNRDSLNSKGAIVEYSLADYESKSSAKFNSVLQDMSNYHADSKNIGFSLIPPTQELDLEAEHNKRLKKLNKQFNESNNNPYLLKKDDNSTFQAGKQSNLQIKGNKYQFSFDKNLEQAGDERIPSCSFTTKFNDAEFVYDCSPIPQRNKLDEELSDLSSIQHNYLQEQCKLLSIYLITIFQSFPPLFYINMNLIQIIIFIKRGGSIQKQCWKIIYLNEYKQQQIEEQLSQVQTKQMNRLEKLEERLLSRQNK